MNHDVFFSQLRCSFYCNRDDGNDAMGNGYRPNSTRCVACTERVA